MLVYMLLLLFIASASASASAAAAASAAEWTKKKSPPKSKKIWECIFGACKPTLQELKHNFEKLSGFKVKSMWAGAAAGAEKSKSQPNTSKSKK